jgi:hypothetical protein
VPPHGSLFAAATYTSHRRHRKSGTFALESSDPKRLGRAQRGPEETWSPPRVPESLVEAMNAKFVCAPEHSNPLTLGGAGAQTSTHLRWGNLSQGEPQGDSVASGSCDCPDVPRRPLGEPRVPQSLRTIPELPQGNARGPRDLARRGHETHSSKRGPKGGPRRFGRRRPNVSVGKTNNTRFKQFGTTVQHTSFKPFPQKRYEF